ncbi:MAG: hypothetical protein Rhob2KO_42940 [Rhodopirellula baltica]
MGGSVNVVESSENVHCDDGLGLRWWFDLFAIANILTVALSPMGDILNGDLCTMVHICIFNLFSMLNIFN